MKMIARVVLGWAMALSLPARGAEVAGPQALGTPTASTAEKLVSQLDDPDYKVRTAAGLQLNNLPGSALGVVEAALKEGTATAESQVRLESALRILRPRAREELRDRQAAEWEARIWHDGYHTAGRAPAPYDRTVDEAISAFTKLSHRPEVMRPEPDRDKVAAMFRSALDQGCDDLYVQCLYSAARGNRAPLKDAVKGQHQFLEFMDGAYDPGLKLILFQRYIPWMQTARFQLLKRLPKIGAQAAADQTIPDSALCMVLERLNDSLYEAAGLKDLEPVITAYVKARPERAEPLIALGTLEYFKAWTARGRDDEVTPEQRKAFNDGLARAERSLEQAWKLDPTDDRAATLMLSVKQGQGADGGGRDAVELWFKRAIEANPSNLDVYLRKLGYLKPDAYGSREEMIAFGRECLKTANWRAGIPFILVDAHQLLATWSGKRAAYYSDPDAWKDVQAVYEGCLLNFPNDVPHRNAYLLIAIQAKQYDIAQQQVDLLGDKADWWFNRRGSWGDAHVSRRPTTRPTTRLTTRPATRATPQRSSP